MKIECLIRIILLMIKKELRERIEEFAKKRSWLLDLNYLIKIIDNLKKMGIFISLRLIDSQYHKIGIR